MMGSNRRDRHQDSPEMPQSLNSFLAEMMEARLEAKETAKSSRLCTTCGLAVAVFNLQRPNDLLEFCPTCYLDYMPSYHEDAIIEIVEVEDRKQILRDHAGLLPESEILRQNSRYRGYGAGRITLPNTDSPDIGDFRYCTCCRVECYCFTMHTNTNTVFFLCPICYLEAIPSEHKEALLNAGRRLLKLARLRESFA